MPTDLQDIRRLPELPDRLVRALQRAGHIAAGTHKGRSTPLSTADTLVLRIAAALRAAGVPAKRLSSTLTDIRAQLPIRTGRPTLEHPGSPPQRTDSHRLDQAEQHFQAALELEDHDPPAARARYLAALSAHRQHVEARINLGRLLHLDGQFAQAERIYRAARVSNALLSFNLALLLEDMDREDEAVIAYREALALDPALHDAHFNLSRLHERAQRSREALHHLLAYRRRVRHSQPGGAGDSQILS
jgi:tetratricopeptide (TPR) repeat protein